MITYAEQQAERKAEYERLAELYPRPACRGRLWAGPRDWTLQELREMEVERCALEYLAHYGWLPGETKQWRP